MPPARCPFKKRACGLHAALLGPRGRTCDILYHTLLASSCILFTWSLSLPAKPSCGPSGGASLQGHTGSSTTCSVPSGGDAVMGCRQLLPAAPARALPSGRCRAQLPHSHLLATGARHRCRAHAALGCGRGHPPGRRCRCRSRPARWCWARSQFRPQLLLPLLLLRLLQLRRLRASWKGMDCFCCRLMTSLPRLRAWLEQRRRSWRPLLLPPRRQPALQRSPWSLRPLRTGNRAASGNSGTWRLAGRDLQLPACVQVVAWRPARRRRLHARPWSLALGGRPRPRRPARLT